MCGPTDADVRAAVLKAPRSLVVTDVAEPECQPGEVLVDVEVAGVCGSDLALFGGRRPSAYPLILGHEAVGRLEDGTRVVVEPNIPCGTCSVCRRGHGNVCPDKRSLGLNAPGVFAECLAVPAGYVHPVPPEVDLLDAVGVEPLAVSVHALRVGKVAAGDTVAVIGCGVQGLMLVQLAVNVGALVVAVDVRPEPLEHARALGAADTLQVGVGTDHARGWEPSVVFETAGSAPAVDAALHTVANGGSVILVGLAAEQVPIVPLRFVRRGLSLIGSLIYDHPHDFDTAIELVTSGAVKPSMHVRSVVELSEAADALSRAARDGSGKTVLDVRGLLAYRTGSGCDAR